MPSASPCRYRVASKTELHSGWDPTRAASPCTQTQGFLYSSTFGSYSCVGLVFQEHETEEGLSVALVVRVRDRLGTLSSKFG